MPSATGSVQEACGFGNGRPLPASGMSTRHWRQAPTGSSSGWSQNRGIWTPTCSAARISRVSLGTLTWMPSMVERDEISSSRRLSASRGLRHAEGSSRGRRAWRRPGRTGSRRCVRWATYSSRKYLIELWIGLTAPSASAQNERPMMLSHWSSSRSRSASLPMPLLELGEHLHQPPRALAARRALAAGLVLVELGPPQHGSHDAGRLVEDLQGAGAEHRAGRADGLEVERHVEVLVGEQRGRGAAGRPELQLVAVADAAREVDQLAQGDAQRGFVLAGLGDVARQARRCRSPWTSRCPSRRTTRGRAR